MDTYSQTLAIRFRSGAAARRARLRVAPLYHDLRAAFSTRMDDNNTNALRVLRVMRTHGQAGTFYLNDLDAWWEDGPRRGSSRVADPGSQVPGRILAAGGSIGGHTLSHDHLPALSKNEAFREIMGIRVALETRTASPVSSFTFPFTCFGSSLRGGRDRADLDEMLRRAGFILLGEHDYHRRRATGLEDAVFLGCDGGHWEGMSDEEVVARHATLGRRPLFLVTMHAWVRSWGGRRFPRLGAAYRKWGARPDWWYCNQNQYAAYRRQARHCRVETFVEGDLMTARLIRPDPLDLLDGVPLTLVIDGVAAADAAAVTGAGFPVGSRSIGGRRQLDVFHSPVHGPVERFAESRNAGNAQGVPGGAPTDGLQARLARRGRMLRLLLRNAGAVPLTELRILFRLPLRWNPGVIRRFLPRLERGGRATLTVRLADRHPPTDVGVGTEYDVAQIDFVGRVRTRVYATCSVPGPKPGAGFARDGFRFMGPLPAEADDRDPRLFRRSHGRPPGWRTLDPARAAALDPDIIPTTGRPRAADFPASRPSARHPVARLRYLLWGYARSRSTRRVTAIFSRDCVRRLVLNGRSVRGRTLALKRGVNEIRIFYSPPGAAQALFSEHHYGCYFRITDAAGRRVRGVSFSRFP